MSRQLGVALSLLLCLAEVAVAAHHTARFFTNYGSPREFQALAFSPKGDLVLFVPKGGPISVVSTATGDVVREIKFDPWRMCFASDGNSVLAIGYRDTKLIDVRTGKDNIIKWQLPKGNVGCVLQQKSGKLLVDSVTERSPAAENGAIQRGDELVALVDRGRQTPLLGQSVADAVRGLQGPIGTPITLRIVSKSNGATSDIELRRKPSTQVGGKMVFQDFSTATSQQSLPAIVGGQVTVFGANGGKILSILTPTAVNTGGPISVSPDGKHVAMAALLKNDRNRLGVEIFDVLQQRTSHNEIIDGPSVQSIHFTPDNSRVLIGSYDRVFVYDLATSKFLPPILIGFDPALVPKEKESGFQNNALESARAQLGFGNSSFVLSGQRLLDSFDVSPDGKFVAIGSEHGHCTLWSTERHKKLADIGQPEEKTANTEATTISPDGKWVAYFVTGTLHVASIQDQLKASADSSDSSEAKP